MADSQNDFRDNPSVRAAPEQKISTSEDEIDLTDYLRILWNRRYFILFGSVLPALLVGLIFFLLPGRYSVTYTYDIEQDRKVLADRLYNAQGGEELISKAQESKQYDSVLRERFYSTENMNRLAAQSRGSGSDDYPPELSKTNVKLDVSGELLTLTVVGRTKGDVHKISEAVRDNLEKVMPIYSVKDKLRSTMAILKNEMSDIEKNRFRLQLQLDQKRGILAKLKKLDTARSNSISDGVIIHFDGVKEQGEYLPLAYQVQAADSNIINIEETIDMSQAEHKYYETMLRLNEGLAEEIAKQKSSYYTIEQYHSFLVDLAGEYQDSVLADYLSAYTKEIENLISINAPLVSKPEIHLVPRDNVKRATIVFVALLMISTFVAFLLESVQKSKACAS